jgi:hypothetical protein
MTMIAFAVHADRAEIITDTITYNHIATKMGRHSKVMPLPHLDAAMLAQGSTGFERRWHMQALYLAQHVADFDDLVREAPEHLAFVWRELEADAETENAVHGRSATVANSVVFLIGYSPAQGCFKAYGYASNFEFRPMDLDGLYVMPSPLDRRPGLLELHRLREHLADNFGTDGLQIADGLAKLPVLPAPESTVEWVELAKAVRRDRALVDLYSGLKTYVAGDVVHTTLRVGEVTSRRVHRFDDSGEEFNRMMAGSLHPVSQAAACDCGSGERFVDCCLAAIADEHCPCGSGTTFAQCCSVNAGISVETMPA